MGGRRPNGEPDVTAVALGLLLSGLPAWQVLASVGIVPYRMPVARPGAIAFAERCARALRETMADDLHHVVVPRDAYPQERCHPG